MKALVFLLLLTLGACCCGVVDSRPEPEYVDVVRYDGRYYLLYRDEPLQPQDAGQLLGPEHTRVLRLVESCAGVALANPGIDDPCGLRDGDSNRLPAQTPLHSVGEFHPDQVLGATHDGRYLLFAAYFPPD